MTTRKKKQFYGKARVVERVTYGGDVTHHAQIREMGEWLDLNHSNGSSLTAQILACEAYIRALVNTEKVLVE